MIYFALIHKKTGFFGSINVEMDILGLLVWICLFWNFYYFRHDFANAKKMINQTQVLNYLSENKHNIPHPLIL